MSISYGYLSLSIWALLGKTVGKRKNALSEKQADYGL